MQKASPLPFCHHTIHHLTSPSLTSPPHVKPPASTPSHLQSSPHDVVCVSSRIPSQSGSSERASGSPQQSGPHNMERTSTGPPDQSDSNECASHPELPRITSCISLVDIPWLHGGVQDGALNMPDLAAKLAVLVDSSNPMIRCELEHT
jgi:hypothetical protein